MEHDCITREEYLRARDAEAKKVTVVVTPHVSKKEKVA